MAGIESLENLKRNEVKKIYQMIISNERRIITIYYSLFVDFFKQRKAVNFQINGKTFVRHLMKKKTGTI